MLLKERNQKKKKPKTNFFIFPFRSFFFSPSSFPRTPSSRRPLSVLRPAGKSLGEQHPTTSGARLDQRRHLRQHLTDGIFGRSAYTTVTQGFPRDLEGVWRISVNGSGTPAPSSLVFRRVVVEIARECVLGKFWQRFPYIISFEHLPKPFSH